MSIQFQGQCNLAGNNGKIAFGNGEFYKAILGMYERLSCMMIKYKFLYSTIFIKENDTKIRFVSVHCFLLLMRFVKY